ncbi:MAG: hypothetical protein M5U26_14265 [Planctomycetota bacterium]|nr:hypothetical protein [Planctomycetota bacterium]
MTTMQRFLILIFALGFLAAPARADFVYLSNGGVLEGKAVLKDGKYHIEQPTGTVVVDAAKVERIEKRKTDMEVFDERFEALETADACAELGRFADQRNLKSRAVLAYRKALGLDPNHELARTALGYVKFKDVWMTQDEAQQARGMVRHGDAWVTPEAKIDLTRLEAQAGIEDTRLEIEKLKLERAKAEAEAARAIADAEALRAERAYRDDYYDYFDRYPIVYYGGGHSNYGRPRPRDPAAEARQAAYYNSAYRNFGRQTTFVPGISRQQTVLLGTGPAVQPLTFTQPGTATIKK